MSILITGKTRDETVYCSECQIYRQEINRLDKLRFRLSKEIEYWKKECKAKDKLYKTQLDNLAKNSTIRF